jgi:hypothetical protein
MNKMIARNPLISRAHRQQPYHLLAEGLISEHGVYIIGCPFHFIIHGNAPDPLFMAE